MAGTQFRMAKTFNIQARTAGPTGKKPMELVARTVKRCRMHCAYAGKFRLQIHQVIKAVDQFAQPRIATDQFIGGWLLRFIYCHGTNDSATKDCSTPEIHLRQENDMQPW